VYTYAFAKGAKEVAHQKQEEELLCRSEGLLLSVLGGSVSWRCGAGCAHTASRRQKPCEVVVDLLARCAAARSTDAEQSPTLLFAFAFLAGGRSAPCPFRLLITPASPATILAPRRPRLRARPVKQCRPQSCTWYMDDGRWGVSTAGRFLSRWCCYAHVWPCMLLKTELFRAILFHVRRAGGGETCHIR
jgi:hypothetical protein